MPLRRNPREAAKEMLLRLQLKSSLMGTTKTPNPWRAPTPMKAMKTVAATMYQPKKTGRREPGRVGLPSKGGLLGSRWG